MIIPKILPDEFWLGYLIRVININGLTYGGKSLNRIGKLFKIESDAKPTTIPVMLARMLGLSVEHVCRFHTLLPILRAVVSDDTSTVNHGDESYIDIINCNSNMILKRELKSCKHCIEEDIEYHGFSYFRREHQLPGFNYCSKHNLKLIRSGRDEFVSPDQVTPIQEVTHNLYDETTSESIQRYKTIVDYWAGSEKPIPLSKLAALLQERARILELGWYRFGKKRFVSDLVLASYPIGWLKDLIPNIEMKTEGEYFCSIDSMMTPQTNASRSSKYALVLSVLFDRAEESLNAIHECLNATEVTKIKSKNRNLSSIRYSGELDKIYIESRGVLSDITRKMDIGSCSVANLMMKNGLTPIGSTKKKTLLAFIDFQDGLSIIESCLKHGVKISDLELFLRKSSIKQGMAVRSILKEDQTAMKVKKSECRKKTLKFYVEDPYIAQCA